MKWISYMYMCIYLLLHGPPFPLHATHLSHHRAVSWVPCSIWQVPTSYFTYKFRSVTRLNTTLWEPMNPSMPGLPVCHQLPESTQTHVHWVGQSCSILCNPMDYNLQASSVHGIFQARILELDSHSLLQGISPTQGLNLVSCIAGKFFITWATREAQICLVVWLDSSQLANQSGIFRPLSILASCGLENRMPLV